MIQTQENDKKPHFEFNLGLLSPNLGLQFFYYKIVAMYCASYHTIQLKGKLMTKLEKMVRKQFRA